MSAREEILRRVRSATVGSKTEPATSPTYRRSLGLDTAARTTLFCERVSDYRAEVHRVEPTGVAATVAAAAPGRLLVPDGVPADWLPPGADVVRDTALAPHELDRIDGTLTGCTLAIAETGTIVLTSAPDEGRRAVTLVPDRHVCIVLAERIVGSVPEAIAALEPLVRMQRRPVTFVSGPSATSDIELDRVEGVHGPRTLVVVVVS